MAASMEWTARTRRREDHLPGRGAACVVEPDDEARTGIADALRNMGYTTHETGSGAVGAFIAEQIHIQVALVNVVLPDVKGLSLIRRFRNAWPGAAIVALTPKTRAGLSTMLARFAGADASIAAPPTTETLSVAVTEATGLPHDPSPPV
jgi:two-component system response regulator AtoC